MDNYPKIIPVTPSYQEHWVELLLLEVYPLTLKLNGVAVVFLYFCFVDKSHFLALLFLKKNVKVLS